MDNLAAAMHAQGEVTAARALQNSVVAAFRRLRGDHHADTLLAMNNLAATMATQGDLIGARILQEQVLDNSRRTLGPEHFSTRLVKQNLASTLKSQGISTRAAGSGCVHCLKHLEQETADHVFPRSWYSDRTPGTVQRWTVPSCPSCNRKLALAEKDLMVTMALCKSSMDRTESGTSDRALRAIGIGAGDLSEKEKSHREKYQRKILSRVVPYGMVKGIIPSLRGDDVGERNDMEPVAILTIDLINPVAEKIVRGLEFKLAGRYIEPPLSLRCFVVPPEKIHVLDYVFEKNTELEFGPGLKVIRAVPTDNQVIAMYRIIIWDVLTVDVAVGHFSARQPL
jgi:hypothetical protein